MTRIIYGINIARIPLRNEKNYGHKYSIKLLQSSTLRRCFNSHFARNAGNDPADIGDTAYYHSCHDLLPLAVITDGEIYC